MTWRVAILLGYLGTSLAGAEEVALTAPDTNRVARVFAQAEDAYRAGRLDDALEAYRTLQADGVESAALFYNMGNAHFRMGETGQAVWHYRRASYLAPRDPDIRANLQFALQQSGGLAPAPHVARRFFRKLSRSEWALVTTTAYWLTCLSAGLLIAWPARRGGLGRLTAGFAALVIVGAMGLFHWFALVGSPELVVIERSQRALYAPLEGAKPHFAAPEGSILQVEETADPWVKVSAGKQSGWLRRDACRPVPVAAALL